MWRTIATERMQRFPPKCQHFMTFPTIISIRSFRGGFFLQFLESPETVRFQLVLLTSRSKDYQSLRHINMPCESVYLRLQSRLGISQVEISSGVCCSGLGRQKKGDWSSMNSTLMYWCTIDVCRGGGKGRARWRGRICTELESILLTPSQISIHAESKARVLLLRNMKGESVGLSPVAAVFAQPAIAVWGHCKMHLYLTVYH